jgi:hypothetical protein
VAADPQTGIITDEKLTKAAGQENSDPAVAAEFLAREAGPTTADDAGHDGDSGGDGGGDRLAWYGDSAYGTGDLRDAIQRAGDQAVIKPKPVQPAIPGGFTIDDFTLNDDQTLTCPAGHTRPLTPHRNVIFGALCRDCPLRAACTTSKTGRTIQLHEHDDLLRAARVAWADNSRMREDYTTHRPNVERAIAQVATRRGRRLKLRYRGVTRNNAWLKRRTAALNLRNLIGRYPSFRRRRWCRAWA